MTFEHFCERVTNLKRAQVNGVQMPYKPLLISAVVLLIHSGRSWSSWAGLRGQLHKLLMVQGRTGARSRREYPVVGVRTGDSVHD